MGQRSIRFRQLCEPTRFLLGTELLRAKRFGLRGSYLDSKAKLLATCSAVLLSWTHRSENSMDSSQKRKRLAKGTPNKWAYLDPEVALKKGDFANHKFRAMTH